MTLSLLAGGLTAALVLALAWWWRSAPTRTRCPRCDGETAAVRKPGLAGAGEAFVRRRWCAACGWSGLGRAGPEWTPGKPAAHGSGFHWGDERFPRDFGFRFAGRPDAEGEEETRTGPPDHPSGFRFSRDDGPEGATFRWGDASSTDAGDEVTREGRSETATGSEERAEGPGFRWRSPGEPRGFYWRED